MHGSSAGRFCFAPAGEGMQDGSATIRRGRSSVWLEHSTVTREVAGSSPVAPVVVKSGPKSKVQCPGGETGRHAILRGWCRKASRFESESGHSRTSRHSSSVVEHSIRNRAVVSSILTCGSWYAAVPRNRPIKRRRPSPPDSVAKAFVFSGTRARCGRYFFAAAGTGAGAAAGRFELKASRAFFQLPSACLRNTSRYLPESVIGAAPGGFIVI